MSVYSSRWLVTIPEFSVGSRSDFPYDFQRYKIKMMQVKLVLQNKPDVCMIKLVLSAQGIFEAGLTLFFILRVEKIICTFGKGSHLYPKTVSDVNCLK